MSLIETIEQDYKTVLRSGDKATVGILRVLKTELHNAVIAKRGKGGKEEGLSEDEAMVVVKRQVKQLEEAKEMFAKGGRADLAAQNESEIAILKKYLPETLSEDAVREVVKKIFVRGQTPLAGSDPAQITSFGKVMGLVMKELKGRADGNMVGKIVKEAIAGGKSE